MSLRAGKRVAALLAVLAVPLAAGAFIPEADRIARAIARANIDANRDQPLRFEVILRIAGGPVVAQGELETHPMEPLADHRLRFIRFVFFVTGRSIGQNSISRPQVPS